ncbi:MAG: hypothetical protein GX291_07950 [Tissierellia bacterium]|jgi:uncharacterized protein Veg|nr:Veg family protein [Bacillota bacterium]NLK59182.1 hypothetical protein [Tissierellia bacterium]
MVVRLQSKVDLNEIRKTVEDNLGKEVILKANKGRRRIVTKKGILTEAYPSVFTVQVENEFDTIRTVSYSYTDVLTSTVELKIC